MHQDHPTYHPEANLTSGFNWAPQPSEAKERPGILILSHDYESTTPLMLMCEMAGYRPVVALSDAGALVLVRRNQFSLMMTDFHLPMEVGSRWVQRLEKAGVNLPVIVLTDEQKITEFLRPSFSNQVSTLINPMSLARLKATLKETIH